MSSVALSRLHFSWRPLARALPAAKVTPFPAFIQPCLALPRNEVPTARGLVHELKLDGYRMQAHIQNGRVRLYTRGGFDWTSRFATIVASLTRLAAAKLVLDGEIICADRDGRPNFSALQDDLRRGRHDRLAYYAFDLLHFDGFDTRPAPLLERKRVLQSVLSECPAQRIFYSEHFEDGSGLYARATDMKLEGIISKMADAPYRSGRCEHWLKVKCWRRDRFVVVGFVPEGASGILKLRLARREAGALIYVGRVGTGWDQKTAGAIRRALEPLPGLSSLFAAQATRPKQARCLGRPQLYVAGTTSEARIARNNWAMWQLENDPIDDVVMAPTDKTYFDAYQSRLQALEPQALAKCLPLDEVYTFEPIAPALSADEGKRVPRSG